MQIGATYMRNWSCSERVPRMRCGVNAVPLIRGLRCLGLACDDPGLQRTAFVAPSAKTRVNALLALRRARETIHRAAQAPFTH